MAMMILIGCLIYAGFPSAAEPIPCLLLVEATMLAGYVSLKKYRTDSGGRL
jgi:hypothetical protein